MFRQQQRCCPSPACSQSKAVLQARIWLPEPAMKHMACLAGQAQVAQICKSCVVPRSFMPTCSREVHSSSQSFLSCYCKHWAGLAIVLAAMPAGALKARGPELPSEAKLLPVPHMPCVAGLSNDWPPIAGLCPWVSAAAAQCWKAIVQFFFDQVPHRCANTPVKMAGPSWTKSQILQTWRGSLPQGYQKHVLCAIYNVLLDVIGKSVSTLLQAVGQRTVQPCEGTQHHRRALHPCWQTWESTHSVPRRQV